MKQLQCRLQDITVTKPKGLSSRLFFHVYSGPNAIAFAHLSSLPSRRARQSVSDAADRRPGISYCLKSIQVSQNYRNQGVGTALLEEIISFCQDERISGLYGEAKGEVDILRRFYSGKGFTVDNMDNISITI